MRTLLLLIIIGCCPGLLSAQTKTEKSFRNNRAEVCDSLSAAYSETIYWDDSNDGSGVIRSHFVDGTLRSEIEYSNIEDEIMDGKNDFYYSNGAIKKSVFFSNDKLHGDFITYYNNGQIKRKDVYNHGELQVGNCYTSDGRDTVYYDYQTMPEYPGGETALLKFVTSNLVYPKPSKKKGIEGTVIVGFVVDKNGNAGEAWIVQSVDPLLDKEAISIVKQMPQWIPGMQDGRKVSVMYSLPVRFAIK